MPAGRSWLQPRGIIDWLLIRNAQGSIQDEQDRDIVVGLEQAWLGQGQGQGGDSDRGAGPATGTDARNGPAADRRANAATQPSKHPSTPR